MRVKDSEWLDIFHAVNEIHDPLRLMAINAVFYPNNACFVRVP